jgi:uncharacterized protein DUF3592
VRQCVFRNGAFFAITPRLEINIRFVLNLFMLFAPLPPSRWTDPSSWPLFFKVWMVFLLVGWLVPLWRWLQRERQKSWPSTSGRIDSAHIGEPKRFLGLTLPASNNEKYTGVLAYSYDLSGNTFHGEYRRALASEAGVDEFMRGLQGQTVSVQYHPNKSERSALLEETVETLLRNRPPLPNAPDWRDSLPRWLKALISTFTFLALIGLLLSIWVHISALFGHQPSPAFWGLHVGVFIVFFPAIFVAQKRLGTTQRKDFWKAITKGSPDGVRYMLYFFFAYASITSLLIFFQSPPGVVANRDAALSWRGFSAVWMVFYCASFAVLSSALRSSPDR